MPEQYNTPINLTNVCDGNLEAAFQVAYQQVLASLKKGQKGSISITLEMERPANLDTLVNIGYKLTPKFPATSKISVAQISEDGSLKVERPTERLVQLNVLQK